jgi:Tfp pilus assembly protein FimV
LDLAKKEEKTEELQEMVNSLTSQLEIAENELTAKENIVSMAESAVLTRRSTNNTIRIASSIERILKNKK